MFLPVLLTLGLGLARVTAERVSLWALTLDVYCTADDTSCLYYGQIEENLINWEYYRTCHCNFTIEAAGGMPASNTSFVNATCDNPATGAESYSITGVWDWEDVITLTVMDVPWNRWAFFWFSKEQFATSDISEMEAYAYPIGEYSRRDLSRIDEKRDDVPDVPGETWTVSGLWRYLTPNPPQVTVGMNITDETGEMDGCVVTVDVPPDTDLRSYSWFSQPCGAPRTWFISWGYDPEMDSAVMSVVNSARDKVAYFGWDNVNAATVLGDAGPNKVSGCKC